MQEALDRVHRVTAAVEMENARPPPNTVERFVTQRQHALLRLGGGGVGGTPQSAKKGTRSAQRARSRHSQAGEVTPVPYASQP